MDQLKNSYLLFLKTNKFESTNVFLNQCIDNNIGANELQFDRQDKTLFDRLQDNKFIDFAFERINYDNYWVELPKEEREKMIRNAKKKNHNSFTINPNSDFLICLKNMAENDSVAYYYTDLISTIGSPGPTIFSRGLIEMSKRFEQNQETIEWLAIINLYYPLLIQEFEK